MESANKKLMILYILDVLRNYSDESNKLKQADIIKIIKRDYGMDCERKAIARNIALLIEDGQDIATPDETHDGYYLREREFEQSELRLLIDSVLTSRYIPTKHAGELIDKIKALGTLAFRKKMLHVKVFNEMPRTRNNTLFYNIDIIDEAIETEKKVMFTYNKFSEDKVLKPKSDEKRTVNPYQIAVQNGRYYLIGNMDKYDDLINFRLDLITGIEILPNEKAKPMTSLPGHESGFDLPKYMGGSIYMFSGERVRAKILIPKWLVGDIIDWFGDGEDVKFKSIDDEMLEVRVYAVTNGIRFWALQYGPYAEVLEPKELRDAIAKDVEVMHQKYRSNP